MLKTASWQGCGEVCINSPSIPPHTRSHVPSLTSQTYISGKVFAQNVFARKHNGGHTHTQITPHNGGHTHTQITPHNGGHTHTQITPHNGGHTHTQITPHNGGHTHTQITPHNGGHTHTQITPHNSHTLSSPRDNIS